MIILPTHTALFCSNKTSTNNLFLIINYNIDNSEIYYLLLLGPGTGYSQF